jgi:hypothetical protein
MLEMMAVAAVALSVPQVGYEDAVFVQTQLQRVRDLKNQSAAVTSELWIGPDGKVLDCKVVRYAGSKELADHVCELMKRRRLNAPGGPSASPAYALIRTTTGWGASSQASGQVARDLAALDQPDKAIAIDNSRAESDIRLSIAVDVTGRASACRAVKDADQAEDYCGELNDERFAIRHDEHGRPVTYLRNYRIKFAQGS